MTSVDRLSRLLDYLTQDPGNPRLLSEVAEEQLQRGDAASARSTFTRLLAIEPSNLQARYRLAVAERIDSNARDARARLQAMVDEGHVQLPILEELARSQAQLGEWASVVPTLSGVNADELPPHEGDAVRLLRLRAHHRLGAMKDALAEARAWQTKRGPELPLQGMAAIATLMLDAELFDETAKLLAHVDAESINSNAELAAATGFVELGLGKPDDALVHFKRSADMQPQLGRARLGAGLALAARGEVPQAIEALKAAVAVTPDHLGSWHTLAWMQLLSKDVDGAAASFEAALTRDDNFSENHGGMALIAALRGDKAACERSLRTAVKLDALSMNAMVARTVLERGPGALDEQLLSRALDRFMGLAVRRNPGFKSRLAKMMGRGA